MRILFQGDSITDGGRDRSDPHDLGLSYPGYAAKYIRDAYPRADLEFIDLGISGDRTDTLLERWESDAVAIQPDVTSILIGINDAWYHAENKDRVAHTDFERCYRACLESLKTRTSSKIIILEPFLCYTEENAFLRCYLDPKIQIVRKLAREYADAFVPLDGIFAEHSITQLPTHWSDDGVHPNASGAALIGKYYLEAFKKALL